MPKMPKPPNFRKSRLLLCSLLTGIWLCQFQLLEPSIAQNRPPSHQKSLPAEVAKAVRQDLVKKINPSIDSAQIKIKQASRQTWSDSCLGLAQPDELCAQVLVKGWRVILAGNGKTWTYRTDSSGRLLRIEPATKKAKNSYSSF